MGASINGAYLSKTFKAWAGEVQAFVSFSTVGTARRTEALKAVSGGVKWLFSRKWLVPASDIPHPSSASAGVASIILSTRFIIAFFLIHLPKYRHLLITSCFLGLTSPFLLVGGCFCLKKFKDSSSFRTGGLPFEGGVVRAVAVGALFYGASRILEQRIAELKPRLPYYIASTIPAEKRDKLTLLLNLESLREHLKAETKNLLGFVCLFTETTCFLVLLVNQILGYLSSKISFVLALVLLSPLAAVFDKTIPPLFFVREDNSDRRLFLIRELLKSSCEFILSGFCYRLSGNLFAPCVLIMLRKIDIYLHKETLFKYINSVNKES